MEMCSCGTFAIGRCTSCGAAVCGDHSLLHEGKRICGRCRDARRRQQEGARAEEQGRLGRVNASLRDIESAEELRHVIQADLGRLSPAAILEVVPRLVPVLPAPTHDFVLVWVTPGRRKPTWRETNRYAAWRVEDVLLSSHGCLYGMSERKGDSVSPGPTKKERPLFNKGPFEARVAVAPGQVLTSQWKNWYEGSPGRGAFGSRKLKEMVTMLSGEDVWPVESEHQTKIAGVLAQLL
jgi:hypothetical protein